MSRNTLNTLKEFKISASKKGKFYSLPALEKKLGVNISRLPVSIRIVLESVLRNCDGQKVTEEHVKELANWSAKSPVLCCKTSPACHCWRIWQQCVTSPRSWVRIQRTSSR